MTYSCATVLGNGSVSSFTVPFPYINPANVTVRVNGELTSFTWNPDATIEIDPAPAGLVEIRRVTSKEESLSALSALYCAQEAEDSAATLADALDALQLASYAALRDYTGPRKAVYITGTRIKGLFIRNDSDVTGLDDGGITIVSTSGVRWERDYGMVVDSAWYSPAGDGVANDYPMLLAAVTAASSKGKALYLSRPTTAYYIGSDELVFTASGFKLFCAPLVEIRGYARNIVSFRREGGTSPPSGAHPASQYVEGLTVRSVTPFSADPDRAGIRVCGSASTFVSCGSVTSADAGGGGWSLESDNTGSGPYYNTFLNCRGQGAMTGTVTATGVGCNFTQLAGTSISTRYPNTNTFTGGRMGQYAINWKIAGAGNRFVGVSSENASQKGTAFRWYAPVTNSNVANAVISPYVENAAIAFEVDPLSLLPSVERHYVTGATTQVVDADQKLGMIGGDGIRGIRLPAVASRSGISLGNVASTDLVTLDWYQEGSITPLITGTTTAGTGTYSGQFGGFTRIGNRVFYDLFVAWTAHTGTGNIQVDLNDIPFPSSASSNRYGGVTIRANTLAYTAGKNLTGYMSTGSRKLNIEVGDPAGGTTTGVALDATASLMITGSFLV